jgi:hypothetical protein
MNSNQLAIAGFVVIWGLFLVWIWTRQSEWWEGGRPINRLTAMNVYALTPAAFLPGVTLAFAVLVVCGRLGFVSGYQVLDWIGVVFFIGLVGSLLVFQQPAFLIPPGYLKVFGKRVNRSRTDR